MTLEEAIRQAEEAAQKYEDFVRCHSCDRELGFVKRCQKCADEHRQLAEWLRELKELRIENKALKNRCADFEHGAPCRYCPLDCEFRKNKFEEQELKQEVKNSNESSLTKKKLDSISRTEAIDALDALCDRECEYSKKQRSVMCGACHLGSAFDVIEQLPSAQPEWNNHTVACLLAELFDDTCACNYNGIDEWLPSKCELLDSCPNPAGVACWEQFLKHRAERRTDDLQ